MRSFSDTPESERALRSTLLCTRSQNCLCLARRRGQSRNEPLCRPFSSSAAAKRALESCTNTKKGRKKKKSSTQRSQSAVARNGLQFEFSSYAIFIERQIGIQIAGRRRRRRTRLAAAAHCVPFASNVQKLNKIETTPHTQKHRANWRFVRVESLTLVALAQR